MSIFNNLEYYFCLFCIRVKNKNKNLKKYQKNRTNLKISKKKLKFSSKLEGRLISFVYVVAWDYWPVHEIWLRWSVENQTTNYSLEWMSCSELREFERERKKESKNGSSLSLPFSLLVQPTFFFSRLPLLQVLPFYFFFSFSFYISLSLSTLSLFVVLQKPTQNYDEPQES